MSERPDGIVERSEPPDAPHRAAAKSLASLESRITELEQERDDLWATKKYLLDAVARLEVERDSLREQLAESERANEENYRLYRKEQEWGNSLSVRVEQMEEALREVNPTNDRIIQLEWAIREALHYMSPSKADNILTRALNPNTESEET